MEVEKEPDLPTVAHIAGLQMQFGALVRQRCGWCGTLMVDDDLTKMSVPTGQELGPSFFPAGEWVETHSPDGRGGVWVVLDPPEPEPDGTFKAPENSCMKMHPEVTR